MNTKASTKVKLPPIEDLCLAGLSKSLSRVFKLPSPTFLTSTDKYRVEQEVAAQLDKKVAFPFLFYTLISADRRTPTYNPASLARHGWYSPNTETTGHSVTRIFIMPVVWSFTCQYLSQDFDSLLQFCRRWIFAGLGTTKGLNFTLTYHGLELGIKVMQSPQLAIPVKENTVGEINAFAIDAAFDVYTYIVDTTSSEDVPIISGVSSTVAIWK